MRKIHVIYLQLAVIHCLVVLMSTYAVAIDKVVVVPLNVRDSGYQVVTSAGQVWMDRNLGALRVSGSKSDSLAYGWLYQWGRLADGHESPTSPITGTQSDDDVPGHGDFINGNNDWRSSPNNNLWQSSGINNPCPSGFRLPTETEWETERASWGSNNNTTGAFSSPLKLTAAGYRNYINGTVLFSGNNGFYWSSTVDVSGARCHYFNSGDADMTSNYRSYGFSVRCFKD